MKRIESKWLLCAILFSLVLLLPAIAENKDDKGKAEKPRVARLYLYEKDPKTGQIIQDGGEGTMEYNTSGATFNFKFDGYCLKAGTRYTLIYYPAPWPGKGLICLGSGEPSKRQVLHIEGSVNTGDLPAAGDKNKGAKIRLVLSADVDCNKREMIKNNPTKYLLENSLITFNDTDE